MMGAGDTVELVRKVLSEQNKALGLILSIAKPGVVTNV